MEFAPPDERLGQGHLIDFAAQHRSEFLDAAAGGLGFGRNGFADAEPDPLSPFVEDFSAKTEEPHFPVDQPEHVEIQGISVKEADGNDRYAGFLDEPQHAEKVRPTLSEDEWLLLVSWVDANAPYYDSFFDRRDPAHPVPARTAWRTFPVSIH